MNILISLLVDVLFISLIQIQYKEFIKQFLHSKDVSTLDNLVTNIFENF